MTPRNFEGRRFGDKHQARSLAEWLAGDENGVLWSGSLITPSRTVPDGPKSARIGDWLIRAADGTVRIERHGNQDGYCTDCGLPVWWNDCGRGRELVSKRGERWCYGKDEAHFGMTRHHALPGMAQYVVQAPDGQVCRCLDRGTPHIHQIITTPPDRAHRLARARARQGDDILADLRAEDGHVPDYQRPEAERRLWDLLDDKLADGPGQARTPAD